MTRRTQGLAVAALAIAGCLSQLVGAAGMLLSTDPGWPPVYWAGFGMLAAGAVADIASHVAGRRRRAAARRRLPAGGITVVDGKRG